MTAIIFFKEMMSIRSPKHYTHCSLFRETTSYPEFLSFALQGESWIREKTVMWRTKGDFCLSGCLTLYILTSVGIFSILFLYILYGLDNQNLFNNQELLSWVIISYISVALMCDSGMKLDACRSMGLNG